MTGLELAILRKSLGLSQHGFAKELGLHVSTVSHWEQHPDKPIPSNKVKLVTLVARDLKKKGA